ncbi:hypothetical protein [Pseudodonghicola flavimaris]|uniref:Periplasmic heavy metal sensor n=1 Tax=Pseudodonghicola flavimaris TaxID=3050036 RepID=A0ABT7EUY7_9RHOB|nr:hypothetical protein [Pseudodonghicola flavimaris]MDK3016155.1 hypothetical protein [Pseudodonghicola flavimaris]
MTGIDTPPRRRSNRGRLILIGVLSVSLLGNAVSVGTLLQLNRMRNLLLGPDAHQALFPREYRRDFNAALSEHQEEVRQALHRIVAARTALVETAMARPFDRAMTEAAMTGFRTEVTRTIATVQGVLLDAIEDHARQDDG